MCAYRFWGGQVDYALLCPEVTIAAIRRMARIIHRAFIGNSVTLSQIVVDIAKYVKHG